MFEQTFKNIQDVLRQESGGVLKYTEQSSWILFLKYLETLEHERAAASQLAGKKHEYILEPQYRWENWACPKAKDGKIDHGKAMTGDDLLDFVNKILCPYLRKFKERATSPNTVEYKIGEIFSETKNEINSGYNLREILNLVDSLQFKSQKDKHELSHLYEDQIRAMGNAGRDGGSYYTPRPLIRAIIHVLDPKIGEKIYDGAVGSAGFLCEAFEYLKAKGKLSTVDVKKLQLDTFYGKEKDKLAYVIAIMNMILHGIESPNIIHTNSLTENVADIQNKDRVDVVLANPPFGGAERKEVQQNFPIRTSETAYLFLQHFIKILKPGGRAGIVIKNTFLSNMDSGAVGLRKMLLTECCLNSILDCPQGTFIGTTQQTVVLFFVKGKPTNNIWYYQLNPGRRMGKKNPLKDEDLAEFKKLQGTKEPSSKSWTKNITEISPDTWDLSVKNPHLVGNVEFEKPAILLDKMAKLDDEYLKIFAKIKEIIA